MELTKLFKLLVQKIVSDNGAGHKELEKCVAAGDVSEEERVLILLKANTILLGQRVDGISSKLI